MSPAEHASDFLKRKRNAVYHCCDSGSSVAVRSGHLIHDWRFHPSIAGYRRYHDIAAFDYRAVTVITAGFLRLNDVFPSGVFVISIGASGEHYTL